MNGRSQFEIFRQRSLVYVSQAINQKRLVYCGACGEETMY